MGVCPPVAPGSKEGGNRQFACLGLWLSFLPSPPPLLFLCRGGCFSPPFLLGVAGLHLIASALSQSLAWAQDVGRWEKSCTPLCNSTCCPGLEVLCPASATGQVTPEQCVLTVSLALGSDWACPGAAACPGTTPPGPQIPCSPSHLSSFHPHRAQPCRMEVRLLFALGQEAGIIFRGGGSPRAAWCQGQGASRQ